MSTQPAQTKEQRVPISKEKNPVAVNIATAIRYNSLLKQRQGILSTTKNKTDFFRYKRFVRAIQSDEFKKKQTKSPKTIPAVPDDTNAINQVFVLLIQNQLVVPVNKLKTQEAKKQGYKVDKTTPAIELYGKAVLQPDAYYAWNFTPPNPFMLLYSILTIVGIFAIILFPLWPLWMRKGVWYLSTGLLGFVCLFFAIAIIRLIIFAVTYLTMSRQFWLFPNLFEDCGVIESFKPTYMWVDPHAKGKKSKKGKNIQTTATPETTAATTTTTNSTTTTTTTTSSNPVQTSTKKRIATVEDVPDESL